MLSPFPGMDPYLERPATWPSFHAKFMVMLSSAIAQKLPSQYYVEVEVRTYQDDGYDDVMIGIPDAAITANRSSQAQPTQSIQQSGTVTQVRPEQVVVPMPMTIKERYLEIRDINNNTVITTIELLSPKNKVAGTGRLSYEEKRQRILGSSAHFVEIDLLRAGKQMTIVSSHSESAYRILVSRSFQRPKADLYGVEIWQKLPELPLPLQGKKAEITISLQDVFDTLYSQGRYDSRIDYHQAPPPPKLSKEEQQWFDTHVSK